MSAFDNGRICQIIAFVYFMIYKVMKVEDSMDKMNQIPNSEYNGFLERTPRSIKRSIKRIIKPGEASARIEFHYSKWVGEQAQRFAKYVKRTGRREVESEQIRSSESLASISYKRDLWIDMISRKRIHDFRDMLVLQDPYDWAPLTAMAIFYTKKPLSVRYTVQGKTEKTNYTAQTKPEYYHKVAIFGLYPGKSNNVKMELIDSSGKVVDERVIQVKTPALAKDIKKIIERKQYTADSAFDMVMLSGGLNIRTCAFDTEGKIRYFLKRKTKAYGVFPLSNGRFLYMEKHIDVPSYSVSQACMMDYMGRIYKTYLYEKGFHHCAREKEPGGNILMGSSCLEGHDENVIIEIDRKTGAIVDSLNLNDVFDQTYQNWTDWVHINAVSYYPEDHSVIVSMRNIHSVAKIDWDTKELKWILANPKMWENTSMMDKVLKPVGEVKWNYQQHAAYQLSENFDGRTDTKHMIVYDNHWAKRRPVEFYDGDEAFSYLSIYTINEGEMTVSMYHTTQVSNSRIRSNSILDYKKKRIFNMAGDLIPALDDSHGMVEEYDFETNKLLNRFYVKPGFFTAYPFAPYCESLTEPLGLNDAYMAGTTIPIQPFDKELDVTKAKRFTLHEIEAGNAGVDPDDDMTIREKDVETRLMEDLLLVKAQDHTIDEIYLMGTKNQYYIDLTTTYQTMDKFKKTVYEIPFWLKDLPEDTYHIYYNFEKELYDSEEEFTLKSRMY